MADYPLHWPVRDSVKYYRQCQASPNQIAHPAQKSPASKGCSGLFGPGREQGAALSFTID